jgi:putative FmdB family regulatory protein
MPTYEYKCQACGHEFEQFQSITAAPIKRCPHCGKNKVKRLISAGAGLIFKGSGFYITDYRSDAYKKAAKAADGAPAGGKASESKPAAAKEAPAAATPAATAAPAPKPAPAKAKKPEKN